LRLTHHCGEFGLSFGPVFVAITAFGGEAGNVDKLFKKAGGEKDEKKRRTYYRKALELINKDAVVLMLGICLSTKRTAGVLRILRPIAGVTPAGPMAGRRIPGLKMARIPSRPAVEFLEHSPFNSTRRPLTLPQRKRAVGPSLSRERERVRRLTEVSAEASRSG